jgi:hypothetical protein
MISPFKVRAKKEGNETRPLYCGLKNVVNQFKYNKKITYENNYNIWRVKNDQEYFDMNLKPYSEEESRRVFAELHWYSKK